MPKRMIRDWTDSETVNTLDEKSEVFFIRLIMKADDFGRFSSNPKLLKSLLYPLKDGVRDTDISRNLAACQKAGLIRCYAVKERPLLEIVNFGQRLDKAVSKYPPPEEADTGNQPVFPDFPGSSGKFRPEEKRREVEEKGTPTKSDAPGSPDFVQSLKANPAYAGINIDRELGKMDAWLQTPNGKRRQKTKGFILNWLNKIDQPLAPELSRIRNGHEIESAKDSK